MTRQPLILGKARKILRLADVGFSGSILEIYVEFFTPSGRILQGEVKREDGKY